MSGMQIFLTSLGLLFAAGGLVMAHARTRPKDAVSALSEWAEFYSLRSIPAWLRNKDADIVAQKWARRVIVISLLAGIIGFGVWYWSAPESIATVPAAAPSQARSESQPPSNRASDEKLPGFGTGMVIQINDITEDRKKYQYSFRTPEGAKAEFYLSPANHFAFSVTDVHGEVYTLEIPLGSGGVPFEQFAYIFCEVGTASSYSYLRAMVSGSEVARRDYKFPLDLGSRRWLPTLGADADNKNVGSFMFSEMGVYSTTLNDKELSALSKNVLSRYNLNGVAPK